MNFCDQIRLLLWKMYIMKKRRPLGTLFEIFLPVILCCILLYVRSEVEVTKQGVTYGISVPVFSIFDVDGLPVSLPGTIAAQDICLGDQINKYIAVTPNDENTRWFLSHLEQYYHYISDQSLFEYYDWNYFSSSVDNFRDLLILANDTMDLCVPYDGDPCNSFIDLLNSTLIGIDINDDAQLLGLIAVIDLIITQAPEQIASFISFLTNLEFANFSTIEFNISNPDLIGELLEFTNETTVCEFLDYMSEIGRAGNNASNFSITINDMFDVFNLNQSNITCNDSSTVLLNAISEQLFNVSFDQVLSFTEFKIYSNCYNFTEFTSNITTSAPMDINGTFYVTATTNSPQTTAFFNTRTRYLMDNDTYCMNESDIYDVIINTGEFMTVLVDILTLQPNPTLNLTDLTVDTIVELLNDSFIENIIENTLNITINSSWINDLYAIDYVDPDLTIGEIIQDVYELDFVLQFVRAFESANNGFINITNINNMIQIIFGNDTNFTVPQIPQIPQIPSMFSNMIANMTQTNFTDDIFSNLSTINSVISPEGQWTQTFIDAILAELGLNDEYRMLSQMLSTPQQAPCLYNTSSNNTFMDIFMFFDTTHAMEEYTQYRDYGDGKPAISAGIVFNHISNESIDYTLRFNMSDIENTKAPYIDKYGRAPFQLMNKAFYKYINSGFLGWQNAIDQTFLRILNYDTAINLKIGIHIFPFPPYEEDYFWSVVKRLLPMLLVIAFSYPFVIITKTIVEEKSLRLKEGFRILGGSNTAYLLSYMITYTLIFSVSNCFLIWLLCGKIFIKTDPLVMWLGIELFGLCMIPLAMIVGMLFDQPRLGALVASLTFLTLFYIYRFVEEAPYESAKNAVCWSGPSAFALALLQFSEYEEYQIGSHWSNINELNELTHFRLSSAYIYMFVDFIIYTLFMFYLDRVWPTKYGVRRPFYAPFEIMDEWFDKIKWCRDKRGRGAENMSKSLHAADTLDNEANTLTIEPVDETVTGRAMLELSDLTKVFRGGNEGRDNIAVNKLNLKMYPNQVFCLLGHNGAGKTTTCNMITGMLSVTSGDAYIADAASGETYSLVEQLPAIRSRTGLCPQHDILFPRMTVWEHLQFYGQVNGLQKGEDLDALCMDLLTKIGLEEKVKFQSRMLSGGQKRKLSVCIALIGRTNLVILDEPTTGMDPFARRATWSLIREYKKGRCIILTTHFMDEAEILADRIGIMAHGKLMCCGSSFYLKQQYDVGYALNVQMSSALGLNQTLRKMNEAVQDHIKDGSARIIGQAATEIVYRISFESNPYLPTLFRYIDKHKKELGVAKYAISATTLEEVFRTINEATVFSKEESVSKRDESSTYNKYGNYKAVEIGDSSAHRDASKVSVHSDTNQARNTATSGADTELESVDENELSKRSELESITVDDADAGTTNKNGETKTDEIVGENAEPNDIERQTSFLDGFEAMNHDETFQEYYQKKYINIADRSKVPCFNGYFWRHVSLQVWKRGLNAKRDAKTFWCQFMIPSFFIIWGLATNTYQWWENQPLYYFNTQDWIENPSVEQGGLLTIPYTAYNEETRPSYYHSDAFLDLLQFDGNQSHDLYTPYITTPFQSNISLPEWQDVLYETRFDDPQSRYLSLFMSQELDPNVIVVGANASAFHSIPTGLNLAASFIAQTISGNHSDPNFISNSYIKTASHPFPKTASQDTIIEAFNGFMTSIILAVGLIFVPAAYIALLVDERTNMVKHQQLVSGMDVISYWTGNFIFDVLSNLMPATLCIIYVALFGIDIFLGEAAFATWIVIVMYGFAVVPFTYLAALFFSSPGTAQALTIFLYYTASVICMIAAWVMDIYPDPKLNKTNKTLKVIYRFLPPFCLSDSFRGIATRDVQFLWGEKRGVFEWEVTGRNLFIMFVESVGYFSLLLLLEYLSKSPAFLSWIGKINTIDDSWRASHEITADELDTDVRNAQLQLKGAQNTAYDDSISPDSRTNMMQEEKADIVQHKNEKEPIEIHGLRKVYPGSYSRPPTIAVQDLWYSVRKGEVFGFLGMNGAGKTTTLSIISGVFPASAGSAYINGYPVTDQIAVRQSLGFCPQFSALFPRLTVIEHLEFFARIKGIHDKKVRDKLSGQLIKDLNLERYTDRVAGKLSGGNQRKLSVGIALIGNPPIVLLDEPTSGMDPVSKRNLWDFISSTMSGRAVILTTHSMEECEALCDRVGIMINGQLACLGTNQHLKDKYGKGYQLDIKFNTKNDKRVKKKIVDVLAAESKEEDIEMEEMNKKEMSPDEYIAVTEKELIKIFGEQYVTLMENYTNYARFQVGSDAMSIADVFEHLETIKTKCEISNYAVSQISLEQIFLGFAKQQKAGDDNDDNDNRGMFTKCLAAIGGCFVVG